MKERHTGIHTSTHYLPLIRNYADALLRFQQTKPIRGRSEDMAKYGITSTPTPTVPLGRRGDVDIYSMRKLEDGSIQLINYRNPLLTFTPDNLVHITPKYGCLMESGMLDRVLGIKAWLDRRKIGIKLTENGDRHAIEAGKTLTLKSVGEVGIEHFKLHNKDRMFSYYVNRKASNNVRAQYSGFSQYLHGFLQLRKNMETNAIHVTCSEIADCVGYEYSDQNVWLVGKNMGKKKVWKPSLSEFHFIDEKPQGTRCLWTTQESTNAKPVRHWDRYQRQATNFLAMVRNDQPDEGKIANYYRATLTLLGLSFGYMHNLPAEGEDKTVAIPVSRVQKLWDDVLLKFHSEEMIERREVKDDHLPNDRYNRYVTIMPTQMELDEALKREEIFRQQQDEST